MDNIEIGLNDEKWAFLTNPVSRLAGTIKTRPDDFLVTELPLYPPSGHGDHLYVTFEKRGLSTNGAIARIGGALGVNPNHIGVAGQKDVRAVTVQTISIEHADKAAVKGLDLPNIRILDCAFHTNKLKMGHLLGNRFVIRVRPFDKGHLTSLAQAASQLSVQGVPNYFGVQRFGMRFDNHLVGRALVLGNYQDALEIVLGRPRQMDSPAIKEARSLFDQGDWAQSAKAWPRGFGEMAKLCRRFAENGVHYKKSVHSMGKKRLQFYVSAYQAFLFNQVVSTRISAGLLGRMQAGDLAWKHDKGVCFVVADEQVENVRAQKGEISPSGPIFGKKMKWPGGPQRVLEEQVLTSSGCQVSDFSKPGPFASPGGRRPLRFFPVDLTVSAANDDLGEHAVLSFALPSGCYATSVLRELFQGGVQEANK